MTKIITPDKVREVDAMARARDGLYYGYGEAFTRNPKQSTDCSGLVLQTGAWYWGRSDWVGNRYGSTESFRLDYAIVYALGFKRMPRGGLSALPFKPIMLVGLQHGGGGIYSHTACTLMGMDRPGGEVKQSARGVDWESQGNGVFYYEGARAWNDGLFHDFWYLDAKLEIAPPVNEINAEYDRAKGWIGKRIDVNEQPAPDGEGKFIRCERGHIYFHPKVNTGAPAGMRAIAIPADIFEVWKGQGFERGPLGYPTVRHYTDTGVGTIQAFQGGAIYRKYGTPGGVVVGDIGRRYAALKAEKGPWGYPLGSEKFRDGGQRVQTFEHYDAYWHPSKVIDFLRDPEAPNQ
ncbi:endolysin [Gordonia phage VanDeWege]|uniref:Lysin A n=4 Tax=Wizardvirus TaxID=2169658 RepID=A0A4Y5TZF9_9CAUD|nr:endolysin [Gordonia phage VanDeWege]YP_010102293.1 endolysin [Gordonia phage Arri]YP_010102386.1 endolysin [Gordonia phage Valary]YP_010103052.1 endolysin [Gordonia phage RogerDodger]QDB74624.1 lysin A [Gordonia phage VanDeWege]QDB74819.1 lysin A [Gordonia phage Arri]QDB74910.1 lysin A [Gordonia phage Valary]QDM56124.1 lysin A [Gordonia phage RogerDodger]